jgi:hypothetical protein
MSFKDEDGNDTMVLPGDFLCVDMKGRAYIERNGNKLRVVDHLGTDLHYNNRFYLAKPENRTQAAALAEMIAAACVLHSEHAESPVEGEFRFMFFS